MTLFKALCLGVVVSVLLTGCATNQNSQADGGPKVSGYISTGAHTKF